MIRMIALILIPAFIAVMFLLGAIGPGELILVLGLVIVWVVLFRSRPKPVT